MKKVLTTKEEVTEFVEQAAQQKKRKYEELAIEIEREIERLGL